MRTSIFRHLLAAGALTLAALAPQSLAAQQPLSFGTWTLFEWFDYGAVDGGGFTFESLFETRIRVTDARTSGDAFDILINGTPFTQTPNVAFGGGSLDIADGESAWMDPALSKTEFVLAPGQYTITLAARPEGIAYGEGFLRADELPPTSTVPEPATLLLTASGLAAVGAVARRRRTRA